MAKTKTEVIEQIVKYTGEKYAEEWYHAVFEPDDVLQVAIKYFKRVDIADLFRIIQQFPWEKSEAQAIFAEVMHSLAKSWGIDEEFYPKIVLHEAEDQLGFHALELEYDEETLEVLESSLHFDLGGIIQDGDSAHLVISKVAHEVYHLHQQLQLHTWLKRHPCWHKMVMSYDSLRTMFRILRFHKPRVLLYWLNRRVYVPSQSNEELYCCQIYEGEAIGVEVFLHDALEKVWHHCCGDEAMPTMKP